MSDELYPDFDASDEDPDTGEPQVVVREETVGIAWGFVAFLVFATLIAVFIIQNIEPTQVTFLWLEFETSLGFVITITILFTLVADQVVSFFYRRRKRAQRRRSRRSPDDGEVG